METKLNHEWITVYGVIICRSCGVWEKNASRYCSSDVTITNKNNKLKVIKRNKT